MVSLYIDGMQHSIKVTKIWEYTTEDIVSLAIFHLLLKHEKVYFPEIDAMISMPPKLCNTVITIQEFIKKICPNSGHFHDEFMKWFCEKRPSRVYKWCTNVVIWSKKKN